MTQHLKNFGRFLLIGALWVYILSVKIDGRTLYSYSRAVLVDNAVVEGLQYEAMHLWEKIGAGRIAKFGGSQERRG